MKIISIFYLIFSVLFVYRYATGSLVYEGVNNIILPWVLVGLYSILTLLNEAIKKQERGGK
ncbi:hypothetical protein D3C71_1480990 [compost metagenome]